MMTNALSVALESAIAHMARERAAETGQSYEKAYADLLADEPRLYAKLDAIRRADSLADPKGEARKYHDEVARLTAAGTPEDDARRLAATKFPAGAVAAAGGYC